MSEIILIGNGGHSRACIDVIELSGDFKIAGLVGDGESNETKKLGYSVVGNDDDLKMLRQRYSNVLIAVGQIKSPAIRVKLYTLLNKYNYNLPVIISPRAYVSKHASIGKGTIIMHDAIVSANAKVGSNCIINNKALIEHDATVGDHCHISTGAIVNGKVNIGRESFLGSGVVVRQSLFVGNNCVISAGIYLNNDIEPNKVVRN